jgi:hypothetical protein
MTIIRGGASLRDDLQNLKITRLPLIHDLLYERDIFLLCADAGAGKSIYALNLLAALSFPAAKTFCGLKVERPVRTMYLQLEGDYEESIERLRQMELGGNIVDEKNIRIVEEKMLDVMNASSVAALIEKIEAEEFYPEVIIIDPLYKLTAGDPKDGAVAQAIIKFSDYLYHRFKCTVVLIHHNLKDSYNNKGDKIEKDDAFYGHSFIKNHVRTSYAMKITGANSRELIRNKGRGSDTIAKLELLYDPEHCQLYRDPASIRFQGTAKERVIAFLDELAEKGKTTTAKEVCEVCEVSYSRLIHIKSEIASFAIFQAGKSKKDPELWVPLPSGKS